MKKKWENPEAEKLSIGATATSTYCYQPGVESGTSSIPSIPLFPADPTYPSKPGCGTGNKPGNGHHHK